MNGQDKLPGDVCIFDGRCFLDSRGLFLKLFDTSIPLLNGFSTQQVNLVTSSQRYTLRGLHYQKEGHAESKLFRVVAGAIQLAWVDMRKESRTFLQGGAAVLDDLKTGALVPKGFATGYLTLQPNTTVLYLSDNQYSPAHESGLLWCDPRLNIQWLCKSPILSEKDGAWPLV